MVFGDKSGGSNPRRALRLLPTSRYGQEAYLELSSWQASGATRTFEMGGGLGMVKLASGGHLLVGTGPGGPKGGESGGQEARRTDVLYVVGHEQSNGTRAPFGTANPSTGRLRASYTPLGRFTQDSYGPGERASKYKFSENLTVIPECGSGHIYVIHTSSTDPSSLFPETIPGFWRLSRLEWTSQGPSLNILDVQEEQQSFGRCMHRAAATAWVNEDHNMELYCSEYRTSEYEANSHFTRRWVEY